ncbi:hypothetical protein [Ammonifex thiophilus]|uniref:hypothetical protein n=1 Tax=Ammonifex thiophilus TaxID=444093 RepID=UPI0014025499|nr:hypothetical protein [Ammonifex thiophilus]
MNRGLAGFWKDEGGFSKAAEGLILLAAASVLIALLFTYLKPGFKSFGQSLSNALQGK